jgi:hypothetical protein
MQVSIHVCHMRRRIHVCHMRRRIHVCKSTLAVSLERETQVRGSEGAQEEVYSNKKR